MSTDIAIVFCYISCVNFKRVCRPNQMTQRLEIWYMGSFMNNRSLQHMLRYMYIEFNFERVSRPNQMTQRLENWYIGSFYDHKLIPEISYQYSENNFRFCGKYLCLSVCVSVSALQVTVFDVES